MATTVRTSVEYGNGRRVEVEVVNDESYTAPAAQMVRDLAKVNAQILKSIGMGIDSYILSLRRESERIEKEGERATESHARQFPAEAAKVEEQKVELSVPLPSEARPYPRPASTPVIVMNGK